MEHSEKLMLLHSLAQGALRAMPSCNCIRTLPRMDAVRVCYHQVLHMTASPWPSRDMQLPSGSDDDSVT